MHTVGLTNEQFAILILAMIGAVKIVIAITEFICDRFTFSLRHGLRRRWDRPGAWVADAGGRRGRVLERIGFGYDGIRTVAVVSFLDEYGWDRDPALVPVQHLYPSTAPVIEDEPAQVAA